MPVTRAQVRAFAKQMNELQKQAIAIDMQTRLAIEAVVRKTGTAIQEILLHAETNAQGFLTAPSGIRAGELIRTESSNMVTELQRLLTEGQNKSWQVGINIGDELSAQVGLQGVFFHPTAEELLIATRFTPDLITSVGADMMKDVGSFLSQGITQGKSPHRIMQDIDKRIGKGGKSGVSYQSERIVRTEVLRVHSISLDSQIQNLAKDLPPKSRKLMLKEWIPSSGRNPRPQHQAMRGIEHRVQIDKKFHLPDGTRMRFPRDPEAPARHVINCRCRMVLVPESIMEAAEVI